MTDRYCPTCDASLPTASINIAEGVALCPSCGGLSRLSEVIEYERPSLEVVNNPPAGCTLNSQFDETIIRVSLRSVGGCIGSLFFCLFWNGIVSVFVLIAVSGLYANLVGPPPTWFPAPVMNDEAMSLGMTLFLCIFLIPFVTVGLFLFGAVLMCMMGGLTVAIAANTASVATGVGPLVWRQRFDPNRVRSVSEGKSKVETNGKHKELIVIEADRTVRFGSMMSDDKRNWLIAVLRKLFKESSGERSDLY